MEMPVEKLLTILRSLKPKTMVRVASDEEWNTIYNDIELNINSENDEAVLFWLSWSEQDWYGEH